MAETNNVGWRYVEYMKVGDEYSVRTIGTTIGAVWNASGAIIGSQSLPDIGRRFVCLAPGNGTGTVEDLQLNLNQALGPISGTVAVSNFPAVQSVSGTVDIGNYPASVNVVGTVDVGNFPAFPAIQPVSGTVDVSNLVPLPSANIRTAAELIVGNWFKVETLGNTIGSVWNACGALIGGENSPPIGRVFKCLANGNGSGTVSTVIYNENVVVSNFPSFPAIQPVSGTVDVGNFPAFPAIQPVSGTVDVSNLVPLPSANIRTAAELIVGNWFKVETLGNTIGAVWNACGAIIGSEANPPIGRVFKCLSNGNGTGTVSTVIYSQNVDVSTLPPIAITNIGFEVTNIPNVVVDTLPPIAITNIGFEVTNIPNVVVDTLPPIAITNIGFEVTNIPNVVVDTLPPIAITNTGFEVSNFTPDGPANTLSVSDIIAGQWYKVEFLGDTVSADWIAMGATFTVETFPAISRVFKALTDGNGTGTVSVIIYNEHVTVDNAVLEVNIASQTAPVSVDISSSIGLDIANLPPIAITNIGFEVTNIPNVVVDTLPPIAITNIGFEVTNIPNVVVDSLPPIAITNTSFDVTITDSYITVPVAIGSSIALDIATLPAIAITNTSFAVTNTNATAIAVKPVASGFAATITGPVTTINTTTAVSRTTIDLTSHQIKASGSGTITTMTLSSNLLAATLGTINFVKFYNLPTATQTDTPILKVGLLSNQSLTIDANISFTNGCCVRASNLWADSDTTVPTENITGAFFLRV